MFLPWSTICCMTVSKQERVVVYIDGGNTYRKLKEIGLPEKNTTFIHADFVAYLVGNRELISKRYYVGIVKNYNNSQKGEEMVKKQQRFLDALRESGFDVKPGRIMYDGGDIREKGVDVQLAVELVIGAVDNVYDTAIVVSSDTDLLPAVTYVRKWQKKKIEYVGFDGSPSIAMIKECNSRRIFAKGDLKRFQVDKGL